MNAIARQIEVGLKYPVCDMPVTARTQHLLEREGKPLYFCSAGCTGKCSANPSAYLAGEPAAVTYTCPMHPEVRKDHPGACPKCAMALEPMMPTLMTARSWNYWISA